MVLACGIIPILMSSCSLDGGCLRGECELASLHLHRAPTCLLHVFKAMPLISMYVLLTFACNFTDKQ